LNSNIEKAAAVTDWTQHLEYSLVDKCSLHNKHIAQLTKMV